MKPNNIPGCFLFLAVALAVAGCAGPGLHVRDVQKAAARTPIGSSRAGLFDSIEREAGASAYVLRELEKSRRSMPVSFEEFKRTTPWLYDALSLADVWQYPAGVIDRPPAYVEAPPAIKEEAHATGFAFLFYDQEMRFIGFAITGGGEPESLE